MSSACTTNRGFNSRLREEATLLPGAHEQGSVEFQLTPP